MANSFRIKDKQFLIYLPRKNNITEGLINELYYLNPDGTEIDEKSKDCIYTDYIPKYKPVGTYKIGAVVIAYLEEIHEKVIEYEDKIYKLENNLIDDDDIITHPYDKRRLFPFEIDKSDRIEMLRTDIEDCKYIYDSIIELIADCSEFWKKTRDEIECLHKRYNRVKHLAHLFRLLTENHLDWGFAYTLMESEEELIPVGRDEKYLFEEIAADRRVRYFVDAYDYLLVKDYEALFIKDLYSFLFLPNVNVQYKSCKTCGWVFTPKQGNEQYCSNCNNKENKKKRAKDYKNSSLYNKISGRLFQRAERAKSKQEIEFFEKYFSDFTKEYASIKRRNIQEYGKEVGKKKTEKWLEEYEKNIPAVAELRRRMENGTTTKTGERDRSDHKS